MDSGSGGDRIGTDGLIADVVSAVARDVDEDPIEMTPPLAEAVDPDALRRLFRGPSDDLRVSFVYCDREVNVRGDGAVSIRPVTAGE